MRPLIFLHGAIGAASQLEPLAALFRSTHDVHLLNFSGHGGIPFHAESFSIKGFAQEVIHYMETKELEKVDIYGYSMGGYVALFLALHHPNKVGKIITQATKFEWTPEIAEKEKKMLRPEKIEEKLPDFAKSLAARHSPNDWKKVLQQTAHLMTTMGTLNPLQTTDYGAIPHSVLISIGDRDKMVTLEETLNVYRLLPAAQLAVLPATSHPIEQMDVLLVKEIMKRFLN